MKYIRPEKQAEYAKRYDQKVKGGSTFKQVDCEESLIHLIRINLLKRMESSIYSFKFTSQRLLAMVESILKQIEHFNEHLAPQLGAECTEEFDAPPIEDIHNFELENPELAPYMVGKKTKIRLQDMDLIRFAQDLDADKVFLQEIVREANAINIERDDKINALKETISQKISQLLNGQNKKIIIFTAFADTAEYLYREISIWAEKNFNLHTAIITGQKTETTLRDPQGEKFKADINSMLTHFSPQSKERDNIFPEFTQEIGLLIATDSQIPYPTFLVIEFEGAFALSFADKRVSKADNNRLTIAHQYDTGWINIETAQKPEYKAFLDAMQFTNCPVASLYDFYQDLVKKVNLLDAAKFSGCYGTANQGDNNNEKMTQQLSELKRLESQLNAIRSEIKNETQMNQKIKLNPNANNIKIRISSLKQAL